MLFTTHLATAVLAALVGGPASSSATPLARRDTTPTCQVQYPQAIGFPINYNISVSRPNAAGFQLPRDAIGCQLSMEFPAGYASISSEGTNVIQILDQMTNNVVAPSVTVQASSSEDTHTVVASGLPCATLMAYSLQLPATEGANAYVAFSEITAAGLVLEYNCTSSP